ncbi:helix-turn-helix transcriptional regulator [Trinickia sp. NRRL B-1857]|uniref:helix-turn-helix domain-containing protein n=1 Tax=Trinickia sp. NRRL B-1857 TaxID=3162879 RepID=UPI003D2B729C
MRFTDQLAALRAHRRLSLAAIGGLVGMAVPNLSAVLRGRGDTKASTLESIASALDATWLLVPNERCEAVQRAMGSNEAGSHPNTVAASEVALPRTIEISSNKR